MHDIYRGRSRSLVRFVSAILDAYQGTDFGLQEHKAEATLMDLARLVSSQHHSPEFQEHRLSGCERLLQALEQGETLEVVTNRLSRADHAALRDITKFSMHVGLLHFDRVGDELGVYPHMYESGILLERAETIERGRSSPGIKNPAVPANIKALYEAYTVLEKSYNARHQNAPDGPGR